MAVTKLYLVDDKAERYESRGRQVTLTFSATEPDTAVTTVTGCGWVSSDTVFSAVLVNPSTSPWDSLLGQVQIAIGNIVDGVGFDVLAYAPNGTTGSYVVHVVGV